MLRLKRVTLIDGWQLTPTVAGSYDEVLEIPPETPPGDYYLNIAVWGRYTPSFFSFPPAHVIVTPATSSDSSQGIALRHCTIVGTQSLNLRLGHGITAPVLGVVPPNTTLEPLAIYVDSANQPWFQIRLLTAGRGVGIGEVGWLLAGSKWLNCTPAFAMLVKTLLANAEVTPSTPIREPTPIPVPTLAPEPVTPAGNSQIVANVVQTGQGYMLVFQVQAYDASVGNADGDGIHSVDMWIVDISDEIVYRHHEDHAAYCAFGGGEPACPGWSFADHNFQWPDGTPLIGGPYTLHAQVNAADGRQQSVDLPITIPFP